MNINKIIEITGLSKSTVYRIIKNLDDSKKTKVKGCWVIDEEVVKKEFVLKRRPRVLSRKLIITYAKGVNWNYLGNFNVGGLSLEDNRKYTQLIFDLLPKKSELIASYEKDSNGNYHTHFLIKSSIRKEKLVSLLNLMTDENRAHHLDTFDSKRFYGIFYQLKSDIEIKSLKK